MAKEKKVWYKRWYVWVIALIVVVNLGSGGEEETTTQPAEKTEVSVAAPAEPQAELTIEEKIQKGVVDAVGQKNNSDLDRIVELKVNDHMGTEKTDDKIVLLTLNASDNLSTNMIKGGILLDSIKVFKTVFQDENIEEVTLFWQFPLKDSYGNTKHENVLKLGLSRETVGKINWDGFNKDNFRSIADQYWEHPAFNN